MKPLLLQNASGAGGSAGGLGIVVGTLVAVGLIAAFGRGARRKAQEPPPLNPARTDRADSWTTSAATPGRAPQDGAAPAADDSAQGSAAPARPSP